MIFIPFYYAYYCTLIVLGLILIELRNIALGICGWILLIMPFEVVWRLFNIISS